MFWTTIAIIAVALGLVGFAIGSLWTETPSMSVLGIGAAIGALWLVEVVTSDWIVVTFLAIWPFAGGWLGLHWDELVVAVGGLDAVALWQQQRSAGTLTNQKHERRVDGGRLAARTQKGRRLA